MGHNTGYVHGRNERREKMRYLNLTLHVITIVIDQNEEYIVQPSGIAGYQESVDEVVDEDENGIVFKHADFKEVRLLNTKGDGDHLQYDFDTTPEEELENLREVIRAASDDNLVLITSGLLKGKGDDRPLENLLRSSAYRLSIPGLINRESGEMKGRIVSPGALVRDENGIRGCGFLMV
jgi:hypothetical protein